MKLFEIIYEVSNLKQKSHQLGSNPGGIYQIEDTDYYVKFPDDPDIAKTEVLANKIYELLGVHVPQVNLISYEGQIGLTSKMEDLLDEDDMSSYLDELSKHADTRINFIVDAWLANWDVAGQTFDSKNIMLDKARRPLRIDQGGALSRRAQGGLKGAGWGNDVGELESLRGSKATRMAQKVFQAVSDSDLKAGADKLRHLNTDKLRALIDEYAPDNEKDSLYDILIARRDYILKAIQERQFESIHEMAAAHRIR
jgi:hypothetical protein